MMKFKKSKNLKIYSNRKSSDEYNSYVSILPIQKGPLRVFKYNPEIGINFHLDYISRIRKRIWNQVRVAYAIFNKDDMILGNQQIGPMLTIQDPNSTIYEKAQFSSKHILNSFNADRNTNLIIELQIPDKSNESRFKAIWWTMINLFNFVDKSPNVGRFKLPFYNLPTNPYLSIYEIISTLIPKEEYACIRLSIPGDIVSRMRSENPSSNYIVPKTHHEINEEDRPITPNNYDYEDSEEEKLVKNPLYSNKGIALYLNYLKNYRDENTKIAFRCSIFYGQNIVNDVSNKECVWNSSNVFTKNTLKQEAKSITKINELAPFEKFNISDTVLPISQATAWYQDFYNVLWDDDLGSNLILLIEMFENKDESPVSITACKLNNKDGTIKYGLYEFPMYSYPLK